MVPTTSATDTDLLRDYATTRNAEAFAELVRRYANLVFATARRVTGNHADAEDVTQSCFLELARKADAVHTSVAGWLHGTATRCAITSVRRTSARRRHEAQTSALPDRETQPSWQELEPLVDAAIDDLPDELRDALVLHFLEGLSQTDLAARLGVNQSTISRRIERAIEQLRTCLQEQGETIALTSLAPALMRLASGEAPAHLLASVTKIGLAGAGASGGAAAAGAGSKLGVGLLGSGPWFVILGATAAVALIVTLVIASSSETRTMSNTAASQQASPVILANVPPGHPGDDNIEGLEMMLHCSVPASRQTLTYDRLMGLSGMAFIIQAQDNLPRPDWWPIDSWGFYGRLDFLSRAIGHQFREVPEVEAQFRANPAEFYRRHFGPEVKASIDAGKPLLGRHDRAFLILGYDDPGKPPLGRIASDPNPALTRPAGDPSYPWGLLVLGPSIAPLAESEADREALNYAVSLASDQAPASPHLTSGRKSYEVWSALLRDRTRQVKASDHETMLLHLRMNRSSAIAFCRELAGKYPGPTATHLTAAADCYQQLLDASAQAKTGDLGNSQQARDQLADLINQFAALDKRAASQLRLAADSLASPTTRVIRRDGRVWIEGLEGVNYGGAYLNREDSQVACLVAALRCAGQDVTYADVMGLSGCAFKLTLGRNIPIHLVHSEFGMEWGPIMRDVFGMTYNTKPSGVNDQYEPNWRTEIVQKIRPAFEQGIPAYGFNSEWYLLVGYAEDGSSFKWVPYPDGGNYREGSNPGDKLWFYCVITRTGKPMDRKQALLNSLQTAIRFATTPTTEGDGAPGQPMYWGFAAYEVWIDALQNRPQETSAHANAFTYTQLLTSRQAAADYLSKHTNLLNATGATHIREAAAHYRQIADRLRAGADCVKLPWDTSYTPENRARQIDLLRASLTDERAAIAAITQALDAARADGQRRTP